MWNNFFFANLFMGNSIKYREINWCCLKLPRQTKDVLIMWPGWNSSTHSVGGTLPTKTPSKLYSTLCINPYYKQFFPNCDISCIMDQSTNKTTKESYFTCNVWGKLWYPGSHTVPLATNHSMGYRQDGHTVSWCCLFWISVLKKCIELVLTHLWKVNESIYVSYFQQKDIHTK